MKEWKPSLGDWSPHVGSTWEPRYIGDIALDAQIIQNCLWAKVLTPISFPLAGLLIILNSGKTMGESLGESHTPKNSPVSSFSRTFPKEIMFQAKKTANSPPLKFWPLGLGLQEPTSFFSYENLSCLLSETLDKLSRGTLAIFFFFLVLQLYF